jgi:spore coat protein U-like protein
MRKLAIGLGAAVGLATMSTAAFAATVTSNFQVRLSITAQCLAATTNDLDFGTSGFLSSNVDAQSSIAVQCTNTTPYNVGFDQGVNGTGVTARKLKGGPTNEEISYAIYSNAGRTTNWGNTVGTDTVAGTGNGAAQTIQVYGRVPAQTTPTPGTYTDTITVTVTY